MKVFTQDTIGYEQCDGYKAFKRFFDAYLLERNYKKTFAMVEDEFYSLGTGGDEVAGNKAEFSELLSAELSVLTAPMKYEHKDIRCKEVSDGVWVVMAAMVIYIPSEDGETIPYETRFTGCFKCENENVTVVSTHMSEASVITEEKEFLPLKYISNNTDIDKSKTEQIVFDIMSKSMPGGIISGYAKEGFPIYFVNDTYLQMLGYSTYDEYNKEAQGMGVSHIHPDDRDMVNRVTMNSYNTDTQYGIEYRIRHKEGHYIHVYDIGKKMVTPDNKEVIVCVLYDMSEDAKLKEVLIKEASYDILTGVHNRRGGIRSIDRLLRKTEAYSFAFFDIDNLKKINDYYDHTAGDEALKTFAEILIKHLDNRAVFARVGGDEFVAFIDKLLDEEDIKASFARVEEDYCKYIQDNYPKSNSSVSIGCVKGIKETDFDELYQVADKLMYEVKHSGKKGYKIVEM